MQRCQRGGQDSYNFIESDDFHALFTSLVGRTEIMDRFWRRIRGHSRKISVAFKKKIQKKRDHIDFVYDCGESALRNSVNEDGEELDSWRTTGDVGKAARNVFPVVNEEFDPFIIMEGPQTQVISATTPLMGTYGSSESTSTTPSGTAYQSVAPAQYESKTRLTDTAPLPAPPDTEAQSEPKAQADTETPFVDATPMRASDLTQVQKCIFCTADPQGTHKRFDKIEKANKITCNKEGHDIFTCGRCTSNYHPVADTTSELKVHALPRIILTSPDSKHSSVLESFMPNKKALYPPPKRRGRADWRGYKWLPKVRELWDEKTRQLSRARIRHLRRQNRQCGGVQLLAKASLASTPISFFPPTRKATAKLDMVAQAMASIYASPIATASTGSASSPIDTLAQSDLPNSEDKASRDLKDSSVNRSYSDVARDGGGTHKLRDNDLKPRKTESHRPFATNKNKDVASQELENFIMDKASHIISQKSEHADTLRADDSNPQNTKPTPPITFSCRTARPKLNITFGAAGAGAKRGISSGKASFIDLANGSSSHRPLISPSVYTLIFTTTSELCKDEDPSSPTSRPPSPTWSTASSDSSCVSETDMHAGWETFATAYDDSIGGLC
ncbi:uncharacterized protein N0V89_007738 [Didymosphaeria variabile]|uniref:Uncharacterized protein n=1 Tax=Didymosphaeria variabile TaxID=1932322 RepID=A0A9W9CAH2_9PLEO|nr:uncharacterized protein N0V89_007738 [Didymosphaeria variabile]KAJ4352390.1 hypothetical protein N0V89_007738 [Didymosphaeria variabile]